MTPLTEPERGRFVSQSLYADGREEEGWLVVRLRREDYEGLLGLEERLQAAERDRDEAIATMREIQRKYVRTDKA